MLIISETKRFTGFFSIGTYSKVPMARRLVTSSKTSRESWLWRHNRDVAIFKVVAFGNF